MKHIIDFFFNDSNRRLAMQELVNGGPNSYELVNIGNSRRAEKLMSDTLRDGCAEYFRATVSGHRTDRKLELPEDFPGFQRLQLIGYTIPQHSALIHSQQVVIDECVIPESCYDTLKSAKGLDFRNTDVPEDLLYDLISNVRDVEYRWTTNKGCTVRIFTEMGFRYRVEYRETSGRWTDFDFDNPFDMQSTLLDLQVTGKDWFKE